MSKTTFVFVGERPSPTALRRGFTWLDGRLAAKQLFDGLRANRLRPEDHTYCNLYQRRLDSLRLVAGRIEHLRRASVETTVVAMGQLVSNKLKQEGVPHLTIVHPAARGKIRAKARYAAHLKRALAL